MPLVRWQTTNSNLPLLTKGHLWIESDGAGVGRRSDGKLVGEVSGDICFGTSTSHTQNYGHHTYKIKGIRNVSEKWHTTVRPYAQRAVVRCSNRNICNSLVGEGRRSVWLARMKTVFLVRLRRRRDGRNVEVSQKEGGGGSRRFSHRYRSDKMILLWLMRRCWERKSRSEWSKAKNGGEKFLKDGKRVWRNGEET